ncbi:Leucine carboxyl methyltransferase [Phytophthora palmivora]|uniref:Leucine carboxyl methyltransferase 1 n=1 Tax=Phytophthora palmivora TaxID=4796 RepID=A0A2P4Y4X2_9STRA|nr:Leucine carboxyl methyltransferase [Phytophthora palmivora]
MQSPAGSAEHDSAVRETASDASLCKLSASKLGYYADPFVQFFVKAPSRRMPIINRGYYARVAAVEALVRKFLEAGDNSQQKKQVVILGAGLDTMFFRLKSSELLANCEYFELDFPDVTMQKVSTIKRRKPLNELLGLGKTEDFMAAVSSGYAELNVPGYHLLPCDLRDLQATTVKMEKAGVDRSVPTLFVSECVLIYMEAKFSKQLVAWAASYFDDVSFALYEQILPDDAFGKVMMSNIKARGCDLLSIYDFPTIEAQIARFTEHHYEVAQCWDMNKIYYHYLDPIERVKRERLEIFDELEEFHLLQAHYCIVVASKQALTPGALALALGEAKA